jgi:predicted dehydrogenase
MKVARMHPVETEVPATRPRLGFAGVGWIGLNRLQAIAAAQTGQITAIQDVCQETARAAARSIEASAPEARVVNGFEELLAEDLDGIVIATPSGMHATQASAALATGRAVFCQKPLARTAAEAAQVIAAATASNRLLAVDFSYRTVAGVPQLVGLARSGSLGTIYAVDLVFHNAYGPDKPWFYDLQLSGGGCVMDLGIHLLDLALLVLDYPRVSAVSSRLHAGGKLLRKPVQDLEEHAFAEVDFASGATARIACSWRLPAGRDAVIEAAFYGTLGSVILRNIGGSFYNFTVEHCVGTTRRTIAAGDDRWGGRAANAWVRRLSQDACFDEEAVRLYQVSALIDAIYGR